MRKQILRSSILKYTLFPSLVFGLLSCSETGPVNDVITCDLTDGLETVKPATLSEVFEDYELIKLETTEDCIIGKINKILTVNDILVIHDRASNKVLLFDRKGTFLRQIGRKGKGPGEYLFIWDIAIDKSGEYIYINDNGSHKIIKYSTSGAFINEYQGYSFRRLTFIDENRIGCYHGPDKMAIHDGMSIGIIDTQLSELSFRFNNNSSIKNAKPTFFSIYNSIDTMSYWDAFNGDTIYRITRDTIFPKYNFRFPNGLPVSTLVSSKKLNSNLENSIFITSIIEIEDYFFIELTDKRLVKRLVFDKKDHKSFCLQKNDDWEYQYFHLDGLINDFDCGIKLWPHGALSRDEVYAFHDIITIKGYLKESATRGNHKNGMKNSKIDEISQLLEDANINDNPVVFILSTNK